MAVKQKMLDCTSPLSNEARLQIILRALQDVTSQNQAMQDKICAQVVCSLGTVSVPSDAKIYMQFITDIKSIQEMLAKHCTRYDLVYATLKTLYSEISKDHKVLSPAMSIVLQLIKVEHIPAAVDLILQTKYTHQSLKNSLLTLCTWLTKWTWTENLGPLVLAFMQGLEKLHYYDILLDVTLITIEPLFKLLIVPEPRKNAGPIVLYMLLQVQPRLDVFHKILPHVLNVTKCLARENSDSSLVYLNEIVNLTFETMDHYPQYHGLYTQIKQELEPYLPAIKIKQVLTCRTWIDGASSIVAIQTSIGKVGLNNLGNTCYMNSVLQALFMTKVFRNEVLLHTHKEMLPLFLRLQVLFALLQHSKKPSLSPNDIHTSARPPGFQPGHQHDSSEFLGYLLDSLHEQEKTADGADNSETDSEAAGPAVPGTIVQSVFGGRTVSVSSCNECGTHSERVDNFRELQLSFPNTTDDQSVQTLLDYYLQPEKLSGDNQYHCDTCEGLTDGERVTSIEESPVRLILTLKHFRYDPASQQRTKLLQSVKLDDQVHLKDDQFELYAAVVHCGSSVDSGHYYTFARDGEDWYKFNDGFVTKSVAEELCGLKPPETPYILFYRRQNCSDPENLHRTLLPPRLQLVIAKDHSEFETEKKMKVIQTYNSQQNRNDEPPPPGCGGAGFANNSSNMYVC